MLANYLKNIRAQRKIATPVALSQLQGWSEADNGAITKQFMFEDFSEASNFMQRYADYCHQVNATP